MTGAVFWVGGMVKLGVPQAAEDDGVDMADGRRVREHCTSRALFAVTWTVVMVPAE